MKRVFGKDRIAFGACSLSLPGGGCNDAKPVRRSYGGFDEAAAENAVSRVCIGFHFRDAVEKGLKHGQQIGEWTIDHVLQPDRAREMPPEKR
jgi:hypothetical protein